MNTPFTEFYNGQTGLIVGKGKSLFSEQTPFQKVEVFKTDTWGNLMTIDGLVMLSEKDEFVYHEMIAHTAMFSHPNPKTVLIIGGGDGGTAREVLKHNSVERVDMVEIDEAVVRASKLFMPKVGDFDNPKLHVHFADGVAFLKDAHHAYDVIIIDGSDPVGPAEGLFKKEFHQCCFEALTEEGVLTAQAETPWVESYHESMKTLFSAHRELFSVSKPYTAFIPLYPTGMWTLAFASKGIDPNSEEVNRRIAEKLPAFDTSLNYYNQDVHNGCFALPTFLKKIVL